MIPKATYRKGLSEKAWRDAAAERTVAVLAAYRTGRKYSDIAQEMGVSRERVRALVAKGERMERRAARLASE